MFHNPKLLKKMKQTQTNNTESGVTLADVKRLSTEAYEKAIHESKDLFDRSLRIDQKISDGITQVDKHVKWYATIIGLVATIVSFIITISSVFGLRALVRQYISNVGKAVSERLVSKEISNQLKRYSDDNVASLIAASVQDTEERVKAELEQINHETSELQSAIFSAQEGMKDLSAGFLEAKAIIDVYEQSAAARAGDRMAYDELRRITNGNNRVSHIATLGVEEVTRAYEQRKNTWGLGQTIWVDEKTKEETVPVDIMMSVVLADIDHSSMAAINTLANKKNRRYTAIFVWAVEHSKYLDTVYAAIRGVEASTGQQFSALGIDEVLEWWTANQDADDLKCEFEQYLVGIKKPEETSTDFVWRQAKHLSTWLDQEAGQYQSADKLLNFLTWLAPRQGEDAKEEHQIMMEKALEYLERETPRKEAWYTYKTAYYALYDLDKVVDFVNARLLEHPSFESELRKWENTFFNPKFFEIDQINWPSRAATQSEDKGANIENDAE